MINEGNVHPGFTELKSEVIRSKDALEMFFEQNFRWIADQIPSLSGSQSPLRKIKVVAMRIREIALAIMGISLVSMAIMVCMALISATMMPWIPLVILFPSLVILIGLIIAGGWRWIGLLGLIAAVEIALETVGDKNRVVTFFNGVKVAIKSFFGWAVALFGAELGVAIYLSYVPIANNRSLVPRTLLVLLATLVFFTLMKLGMGKIWGALGVVCLIIFIVHSCMFRFHHPDTVGENATATISQTKDGADIATLRDQITALNAKLAMLTTTGVPQNALYRWGGTTNNPLNIKYSAKVALLGATDSGIQAKDGGTFASFATVADGIQAGHIMLTDPSFGYASLTVEAALRRWSNGGYGVEIAPHLIGTTLVSQLTPKELDWLIAAMVVREGGAATGSPSIPPTAAPILTAVNTPPVIPLPGVDFRDGNLRISIPECHLQPGSAGQMLCEGYTENDGENDLQLYLKSAEATGESGRSFTPSGCEFGVVSCFDGPPIPQRIDPYNGKRLLSFALDGVDESRQVRIAIKYHFGTETKQIAHFMVPVTR